MNIVYIGSSGLLSYIPLQALINSSFKVNAVAVDSIKENTLPTVNKESETLELLAFYNNIPLIKLTKNIITNVATISKIQPDIIIVSCYARKLPIEIISLAKIGCFNIHPSLLPKYRGPTPLFWQFRNGEEKFGVSLHRMTEQFDDGNIIAQQSIAMPDGTSKEEASTLLARLASKLVLKALPLLQQENIKEIKQDEKMASYQTFPQKDDFTVSVNWSAKRIFNFISANKRLGVTFPCRIAGHEYELVDVRSYQEGAYKELNDNYFVINNNEISFKCGKSFIRCIYKN